MPFISPLGQVFGLKGQVFVGKSDKGEEKFMVAEGDMKWPGTLHTM